MSGKLRIIVADDDLDDQLIISGALESLRNHVEIQQVFNGKELIDALNESALPDLIILDINMPVLDGVEALKKIRSDSDLKNIPVYVLSTMREKECVEQIIEIGVKRCISKPNSFAAYTELMLDIVTEVH